MKNEPLTTGDVAGYCHVTHRAVLKWIAGGRLKAYRTPGGHCRVRCDDFISFLNKYNMPVPDVLNGIAPKQRVLIVDDDKNMANAVKRTLLQQNNFEVDSAYDGFDAGRKLLEFRPDVVLLDIRMPGIDGYEVARRIKENPQTREVKIIAMSAFFEQDGKEKISAMGVEACLDKPFETQELLNAIQAVL